MGEPEGKSALKFWMRLIELEQTIERMKVQLKVLADDNVRLRAAAKAEVKENKYRLERDSLLELVKARDDQIAPHESRIGELEGMVFQLMPDRVTKLEHQVTVLSGKPLPPPEGQKTVLGALKARQDAEKAALLDRQRAEWDAMYGQDAQAGQAVQGVQNAMAIAREAYNPILVGLSDPRPIDDEPGQREADLYRQPKLEEP